MEFLLHVKCFCQVDECALLSTITYALNCPHNEMLLKQNSFKTVLKLFCFSFISLWGQFYNATTSITRFQLDEWCKRNAFCSVSSLNATRDIANCNLLALLHLYVSVIKINITFSVIGT